MINLIFVSIYFLNSVNSRMKSSPYIYIYIYIIYIHIFLQLVIFCFLLSSSFVLNSKNLLLFTKLFQHDFYNSMLFELINRTKGKYALQWNVIVLGKQMLNSFYCLHANATHKQRINKFHCANVSDYHCHRAQTSVSQSVEVLV